MLWLDLKREPVHKQMATNRIEATLLQATESLGVVRFSQGCSEFCENFRFHNYMLTSE